MVKSAIFLATVALIASLFLPAWRSLIATSALLLLFAVTALRIATSLSAARPEHPTPFELMSQTRVHRPERPPDLEGLERVLGWKTYSTRDFEHRVRPLLRRLVAYKLLAVHGIRLEDHREAARAVLSDDLNRAIDGPPVSPAPDSAVTTDTIARLLDDIEAI